MSKTIRRKNAWGNGDYFSMHDFVRVAPWQWEWVKKEGKELKKALALYHSDNHDCGCLDGNVPRWYTAKLNRAKRAKARQRIRNFMHNPEVELVFELWKKDAAYYYW